MTFMGNDGVQYMAILSGVGGWPGAVADGQIDPRVRNGALGFTGAMQDLPLHTAAGSTLLVFAVDKQQAAAASQPTTQGTAAAAEQPQ